jgi:hypothetical protein
VTYASGPVSISLLEVSAIVSLSEMTRITERVAGLPASEGAESAGCHGLDDGAAPRPGPGPGRGPGLRL